MPSTLSRLEALRKKLKKAARLITQPEADEQTKDLLWQIHSKWNQIGGYSEADDVPVTVMTMHAGLDDYNDEDREHDADILKNYRDDIVDQIEELLAGRNEEIGEDAIVSSSTGKIRQRLSDEFEGYEDSQEAFEKELERAQKTESRFYAMARTNNDETRRLSGTFLFNRQTAGETEVIDSNQVSARSLITADSYAVEESLRGVNLTHVQDAGDIARHLRWNKRKGIDWNREKVIRGQLVIKREARDIEVNYQFKPSAGNLSNMFINGVGSYGAESSNDILYVVNSITDQDYKKERKLAEMLIEFSHDGTGFTAENLISAGFNLAYYKGDSDIQVERLNRLAYLICIKEIVRRKNQGVQHAEYGIEEVEELPFGIAVSKALQLLRDGHLQMADVLSHDSEFGVFTGEKIMHNENLARTKEKFAAIFELYSNIYGGEDAKSFLKKYTHGRVIPFRETDHQCLRDVNGGENDSSGDEYASSDEETNELINRSCRFTL